MIYEIIYIFLNFTHFNFFSLISIFLLFFFFIEVKWNLILLRCSKVIAYLFLNAYTIRPLIGKISMSKANFTRIRSHISQLQAHWWKTEGFWSRLAICPKQDAQTHIHIKFTSIENHPLLKRERINHLQILLYQPPCRTTTIKPHLEPIVDNVFKIEKWPTFRRRTFTILSFIFHDGLLTAVAWKEREHSFLPSTLTRVQPIA